MRIPSIDSKSSRTASGRYKKGSRDGKGGRPSKYTDAFCAQLIEHMARGLSYESFAGKIRVHPNTLKNWEDKPEFLAAKEEGLAASQYWWERVGNFTASDDVSSLVEELNIKPFVVERTTKRYTVGTGRNARQVVEVKEKYHVPRPHGSTTIFNMKNRFNWRDAHEVSGPDGEPLAFKILK